MHAERLAFREWEFALREGRDADDFQMSISRLLSALRKKLFTLTFSKTKTKFA